MGGHVGIIVSVKHSLAVVDGRVICLRKREAQILSIIVALDGEIATREFIIKEVWGVWPPGHETTVNVHVCALRKKLRGTRAKIISMHYRGYRFHMDAPRPWRPGFRQWVKWRLLRR